MSTIHDDPMPTKRHVALMLVMGMSIAALLCGVLYAIVLSASNSAKINDRQKDAITTIDNTNATLKQTELILEKVEDCTTPGLKCYERSKAQLAGAVNDVNTVVVLAAACASGTEGRDELYIQKCVLDALANRKGHS